MLRVCGKGFERSFSPIVSYKGKIHVTFWCQKLFRTATGQKTFYYRTVNIWNNLNNDIKLCIDVNSFRSKLRGVLLDKFKREE